MSEQTILWNFPDWLEEASGWIGVQLGRNDLQITGDIEWPHIRPWSTVLTVQTENGRLRWKVALNLSLDYQVSTHPA